MDPVPSSVWRCPICMFANDFYRDCEFCYVCGTLRPDKWTSNQFPVHCDRVRPAKRLMNLASTTSEGLKMIQSKTSQNFSVLNAKMLLLAARHEDFMRQAWDDWNSSRDAEFASTSNSSGSETAGNSPRYQAAVSPADNSQPESGAASSDKSDKVCSPHDSARGSSADQELEPEAAAESPQIKDWAYDQDLITCTCGKPDDGRVMVQCDSCSKWYHCSCVRFRNPEETEEFICPPCSAAAKTTRKSSRKRTAKRLFDPSDPSPGGKQFHA